MQKHPKSKYLPHPTVDLKDRTWPEKRISAAPFWCSVDLRDGNQALPIPMTVDEKTELFEHLVKIGFKEIEVGFPSASETEFRFLRKLIEEDRIPGDVTVQCLVQCREHLIRRTFEAIDGAPNAIVHFYNSTNPLQRRVTFNMSRDQIRDIAVSGARLCMDLRDGTTCRNVRFQYSPESFSDTELEFSLEVCEAVKEVIQPTSANRLILNLPATVELFTPNVHADQIEWFSRHISNRDSVIISLHTHNDRGTGVAATELGLMAGAERVEGTLFGNGERTGNVDLVTLALNLMSQGVDPELDLRDLPDLVRRVEQANRLPVSPRHPYAGELVYTAFSGSHQDAIHKGLAALRDSDGDAWEVPYLPIDPADVGGSYEAVIRINSQSGKGGVAHVLESQAGYRLPRRMQIELAREVQKQADERGLEITADQVRTLYEREYLRLEGAPRLVGDRRLATSEDGTRDEIEAQLEWGGAVFALRGSGKGPIDALIAAMREAVGIELRVGDYQEHALGAGADARASAYLELVFAPDRRLFGAGVAASLVEASFAALLSALGRAEQRGWISRPRAREGGQQAAG